MLSRFWGFLNFGANKTIASNEELPSKLLDILKFQPRNAGIFHEAFIPRSAQKSDPKGVSINYERLEFLGDAMIGAVIADFLFNEAPEEKEGYLTQMRSKIVSRRHLNEIGNDLGLVGFVDKGSKKKSSLSSNVSGDLFEALVGAIYEDQGFEITKDFIYRVVIQPYVDLRNLETRITSYKSLILEWAQKKKVQLNFNTFEEQNAEDFTVFVSIVRMDNRIIAKGRGTSKKKAEENASILKR